MTDGDSTSPYTRGGVPGYGYGGTTRVVITRPCCVAAPQPTVVGSARTRTPGRRSRESSPRSGAGERRRGKAARMCRRNSQANGTRPDGPLKTRDAWAPHGGQGDGDIALSFDVKGVSEVSGREWRVVNPDGTWRVVVTKELPGARWQRLLERGGLPGRGRAGRRRPGRRRDPCAPWATTRRRHRSAAPSLVGRACCARSARPAVSSTATTPSATTMSTSRPRPASRLPGRQHARRAHRDDGRSWPWPSPLPRRVASSRATASCAPARYHGWLPQLLLGDLLYGCTVGVIGAGRIGTAFARMMVEGHKMDLVYYDPHGNDELEALRRPTTPLSSRRHGEPPVTCRRAGSLGRPARGRRCRQHPRRPRRRDHAPPDRRGRSWL